LPHGRANAGNTGQQVFRRHGRDEFFFAVGAGLLPIPGGPSNLHGPLWLLVCVGLAFFLAGVAIIIQLLGDANDSGDLPAGTPF